jgi:hypothetical protein
MKNIIKASGLIVLIFAVLSCSYIGRMAEKQVEKQLGNGMNTNKVDSLWPDVPKMDGLGESLNDQMPVTVNIVMHTFVNLLLGSMAKQENNHINVGFIFYRYQGSDTDIDKFYTAEKMKSSGNWSLKDGMTSPCLDAGANDTVGHACIFQKLENGQQQGLIILSIPAKEKDASALIYFFRATTDPLKAPASK